MAKQVRPTRLPCGCVHNTTTWVAMCPKHEAEFNERHVQAGRDYLRMMELASGKLEPSGDSGAAEKDQPQSPHEPR